MERESQFQISPPDHTSVGEAYINGVFQGLSFHTLLTYDPYVPPAPPPVTCGVFDLPAQTQNILVMSKTEPQNHPPEISTFNEAFSMVHPPYNFFSDVASSSHHHLPVLLSLEPPAVDSLSGVENPRRRRKQQKLSEKTRRLQKLLPWDKKMDMATVLEESYKYIKFLQAQVRILQAMPNAESGSNGTTSSLSHGSHGAVGDHLGRLNRQQLLQVLLHSPIAQTLLYSNGCCVYSLEQLLFVKNNAERKAQFNNMLFDSNTNAWEPDSYRF